MKLLKKPSCDAQAMYINCASSVNDLAMQRRLISSQESVFEEYNNYLILAKSHGLFNINSKKAGHDHQIVISTATKRDFTTLYSSYMVPKKSAGRTYYDALIISAPLGICPYCRFGHVTTLDHFLPKSIYPLYSIFPANLIPACTDCNKGKGFSKLTLNKQAIHPYFEGSAIEKDTWLFARIIEKHPIDVDFFITPPNTWDDDLAERLENYFSDFDLAKRFKVQSGAELSELADLLAETTTKTRKEVLNNKARVERKNRRNTWKAALYEALSNSSWYQSCGYRPKKKDFSIKAPPSLPIATSLNYITCTICDGVEIILGKPCPICNGYGRITEKETLEIDYSEYENFPCPNCKMNRSKQCRMCGGLGYVSRSVAINLSREK